MTTPVNPPVQPEYVAARTALLDALDVLAEHRDSPVVVGAQAVYARTQRAGLTVAPYTTDGDLAVDPRTLHDAPDIPGLMLASGFTLNPDTAAASNPANGNARSRLKIAPSLCKST
jgi:hypothetical protein